MDLTLESALSADSILGHLAYLVLVLSMFMRVMTWLRILVMVSAILAVSYGVFIIRDPVTVFWEAALVVVNAWQLLVLHWRNLRARFTGAEEALIERHLPGLTRGAARQLLDLGRWTQAPAGTVLVEEGAQVDTLSYVAEGACTVTVAGKPVAACQPGQLVGEMGALGALAASATVTSDVDVTLWQVEAGVLRAALEADPGARREIEAAFARDMRDKLMQANSQSVSVRAG